MCLYKATNFTRGSWPEGAVRCPPLANAPNREDSQGQALRSAADQPENLLWRCPTSACASSWKLASTSAIRPTAGTRRWREYIFGTRNNIHIIDLAQTVPMLHRALQAVSDTVAKGGRILFVGTKRQAQDAIADAAKKSAQYYVNSRWLGGTLTNWKTISNSIKRLRKLDEMLASDEAQGYTKKERLTLQRERDKLDRALGGIKDMGGLPDLVFVIDTNKEDIAIKEARRLNVPVAADRRHQLRSGRHHLSSCPAMTTPAAPSRSIAIWSPRRRSTAFRAPRATCGVDIGAPAEPIVEELPPSRGRPASASSRCPVRAASPTTSRSSPACRRRSRRSSTTSAFSTIGRSPSSRRRRP